MPDGTVGAKAGTKSIKEANDLWESAKLYMSTRNFAKRANNLLIAVDKLREITEKYPESDKVVDAWYAMGDCYRDGYIRRYDDAIRAFDKVKELDPKNSSDSRLLAGKLADNLGRYDDAYARYGDAIEHDANPRNVEWAKARRIQLEPYLKK
jgi:tetratricopeptide (TPR) repeat protein